MEVNEGFQYVVVSTTMYGCFFAEADRYSAQGSFYDALFAEGRLLHEFEASNTREDQGLESTDWKTRELI